MFDTVYFRLTATEVEGVSFIEQTPSYLDNVGIHDYDGSIFVTGNLDGFRVTASQWQIKIKDGSLCKFYLGDNYQSLERGDVQRAVEMLSDALHLPMNLAMITRLDVAGNIMTQHPTDVYINHLGLLAHTKRLLQPSGLYYVKRNEQLVFYDKNREQRARGDAVPELYRDKHVLRYEQRFMHRLASTLKEPEITGATLFDERFYMKLLKRWYDTYLAISKINDVQINFQSMTNKKQLYRMGVLSLVERAGGEMEMIAQIAEAQNRGELTAKQAYDFRQAVKQACTLKEGLTIKSDAISELDKKIAEAVRFYR